MQDFKAILEPDNYYHIYNRANGREKLFANEDNYKFFLKQYMFYISPIAHTLTYCLMPNHFHFVVKIKEEKNLVPLSGSGTLKPFQKFETFEKFASKQFSNLFSSYTQAFNKQNKRMGSLFMPRFNRKKITSDNYLKHSINYIHQNPIMHHYVSDLEKWKYSSYLSIINNKATKLKKQEVLDLFHDKQNFIDCHTLKKAEYFAEKNNLNY